jgi:hypothetical protein
MRGEVISSLEISDKTAEESGAHLERFVLLQNTQRITRKRIQAFQVTILASMMPV